MGHALHVSGEQIHVAVWPTVDEMHQIACRHYAFERRCFVLAAGLIMPVKDLPAEFDLSPESRPANVTSCYCYSAEAVSSDPTGISSLGWC